MSQPRFLLVLVCLSASMVGCMSAPPVGGAQDGQTQNTVNFLQQKPSDTPDMMAPLEGRLALSKACLYIQSESLNASYAAIWPFNFGVAVQNGDVQILNAGGEVVARVGDQIRLSGGEVRQFSPEEFDASFSGDPTPCTAPYWLVNTDVKVVN